MARQTIGTANLDRDASGQNLTDAEFVTLQTGSNNGVRFDYHKNQIVVLNNPTGGSAAFTLVANTPAAFSDFGATVSDVTVNLAAGKMLVLRLHELFRDSNGRVAIDCDVAGQVIAYDLAP